MAFYAIMPAELDLAVMQSCPDLRTLLSLIDASPTARAAYAETPRIVTQRVLAQGPPHGIAVLMRDTFAALCSDDTVDCTFDDASTRIQNWTAIPASNNIWNNGPEHASWSQCPVGVLRYFASVEQEVADLTAWCLEQQDSVVRNGNSKGGPATLLTEDRMHGLMWELRLYAARLSNFNIPPPPRSEFYPTDSRLMNETHEDRHRTRIVTRVKLGWVASYSTADLMGMSTILGFLEMGFGTLIRHQLLPRKGGLMRLLFDNMDDSTAAWGRNLKAHMKGHITILMPGGSMESAVAQFRQTGLGDNSQFGAVTRKEEEEFRSSGMDGPQYLERFRPLMGLRVGDQAPMHELVGCIRGTRSRMHTLHDQGCATGPLACKARILGFKNCEAGRLREYFVRSAL